MPHADRVDDGASRFLGVRNLWRVFDGDPESAMALARDGVDRAAILDRTGSLVAVRDVSFDVQKGENFIVMGLSGSGKSTLLRCMARLVEPTEGQVSLDGVSITDMGDDELRAFRRGRMAMVFQHFGLLPHRTVLDNVTYGLEIQGLDLAARISAGLEVLDQVGLTEWADHFPEQLSGGMQQRVGLARALAVEPELVFFDEPFSALDPLIRRDMQDELLALQRRHRRTVVFITHDFDEAIKLGDRIAIMKDGAIDQVGTAEDLITRPASDYVREFTRDVARTRIVTAASLMGSPRSDGRDPLPVDTPLDRLLPRLLASSGPVPIVDEDGRHVGDVERQTVLRFLDSGSVGPIAPDAGPAATDPVVPDRSVS